MLPKFRVGDTVQCCLSRNMWIGQVIEVTPMTRRVSYDKHAVCKVESIRPRDVTYRCTVRPTHTIDGRTQPRCNRGVRILHERWLRPHPGTFVF